MSVPGRRTPSSVVPARHAPAGRTSLETPGPRGLTRAHPEPMVRSEPARTKKKRHDAGFLVLSSIVVGTMVLGIVSLNVLQAQTSFRIDAQERRIDELAREQVDLVRRQASLSAPGRIAAWARRHGMRLPDDIRSLPMPTDARAAPAGDADTGSPDTP